ncbi:MAG: exodeoxyribonuclease VII large subunit [Gemmatimonadetes bacterium]|nr:MAG: exodeoxyribonuclease VII large subunit [Gemmatimonadota bacterium]
MDGEADAAAGPPEPVRGAAVGEGGTAPAAQASAERPRAWTVSQVNAAVRTLLESSIDPLWVGGEVANWTRARSGHCYFTLKDERAQLRCALFRQDAQRLPMDPDEGMRVRVFGTLTLYEARGEYQLVARTLEAEGEEGLWRLAFERLRQRLEAEGLLAAERKRPLPRFPSTVGVVTSPTGAALRDILHVVARRAPWVRVVLCGARVQGEGAALDVARAVRTLGASGLADVLIVGRGGGSIEDLWAFNEEPVARAIADCPVPVISAVGHEIDVTISDLVADLRAPTPSAAAEAAVPDGEAVRGYLADAPRRLATGLRGKAAGRRRTVEAWRGRLGALSETWTRARRQRVERAGERAAAAMRRRLADTRARLGRLAASVDALSPLATLRRGFAVALDDEGHVLRSRAQFEPGRGFILRVADGRVPCEVTDEPEPA